MAVISAADGAAEEHQSTMTLSGAKHLARVPGQRRPVEGNDHQPSLGAGNQQRGIIEAQPQSVLPRGDVNDGKLVDQLSAGRDEPMRRVLVS